VRRKKRGSQHDKGKKKREKERWGWMRYLSLTWSPETEVGVYTGEQVREQLNSCMSWNTPMTFFIASEAVYEKTPVVGSVSVK
jgi:hypothetical protein